MKKILLIIALIFAIFQMVVLAVDIDIGSPAIDRDSGRGANVTHILVDNPANVSGIIDTIEIFANDDIEGLEVATFYSTGTNEFSTRDTHTIGDVTPGSKQTFEGLNLSVQAGDYIGFVFTVGSIEMSTSGYSGYWWLSGDYIPCTTTTFTSKSDRTISLYGTGITEVGWSHKWNTQTISKWNTKEILKWNGLD